jgi:hypothetical protein
MNAKAMAGLPIVVSGASNTGNDGTFTVKSISGNILTLNQSNVLKAETEMLVSVGDGMIGLQNSSSSSTSSSPSTAAGAVELPEVGRFTATTENGSIFLTVGGSVDSTAVDVDAGGTGNVAVTSQASFLTIEKITANGEIPPGGSSVVGGNVAVGMSSGALVEYPQGSGIITGQNVALTSPLSIGTPSSPCLTNSASGLSVTANATSPSSAAVYVENSSSLTALGVSTDDGIVAIYQNNDTTSTLLSFNNNQLSETGNAVVSFANTDNNDGTNDDVDLNGTIWAGSITAGGQIVAGTTTAVIKGQALALSAGTGIGTQTSPINTEVTALDASTNTGNIEINQVARATARSLATLDLTTVNGAIASVALDDPGSGYPANSMVLLMVGGGGGTGAEGTGGVVEAATDSGGHISSIISFVAANGGSTDVVAAGNGYSDTIGEATSRAFMLLSASTSNGNINVSSSGGAELILDGISTGSQGAARFTSDADIYNTTQVSSAAAFGNSASSTSATLSGLSAGKLFLAATNGGTIGTTSNPLNTSVTRVTAVDADGLFLSNNTSLTLSTVTIDGAGQVTVSTIVGDVSISTIGNLTLNSAALGSVGSSVSLTATAGTLTTSGIGGSIGADTVNISAEQIGSPNDVIETSSISINATADYGGVHIRNLRGAPLMLTAGAVGPTINGAPTNNIDISSQGLIVLVPLPSTLPGAGTTPIALYSPGGAVTLDAGTYIASTSDIVSGLSIGNSLTPGMAVSGAGIPPGDTIQQVIGPHEIILSEPATATESNVTLTFAPVINAMGTVAGTTVSGLPSTSGLTSGMAVSGQGIPPDDTIAQVNGDGEITLSVAGTSSGGPVALTFYSAQTTTDTGTTTGPAQTPYFDVYAGTLSIQGTPITSSASLLTGNLYGPLVTQTNTAEVLVFAPIALTNAGPLEVTPSMLANGGTYTGSSITIGDLGDLPQAIAGNLVLESTGAIVFLKTTNSISVEPGFTVTIEAGGVAALGNITTANGDVTIVASGNVGVGTVNAGTGTVLIASSGTIFNSNGGTLSIQAGQTNLAQAQIQVVGQGPNPAPSTPNLAQLELQAAQAFATADAASAQAAADQTTADAFQAELNAIETTVSADELTYQNDVTATNAANSLVNADQNTANHDSQKINNLSYAAAIFSTVSASVGLLADGTVAVGDDLGAEGEETETAGEAFVLMGDGIGLLADLANIVSAGLYVASAQEAFALYNDSNTLSKDSGTAATDQSAQDVAYARLLADQDEVTAVAAAYGVAAQDAGSEAIIAAQDQAVAQADSALVLAASETSSVQASGQTVAASVANATAAPLTVNGGPLTITGEAPTGSNMTNLTVSTPITLGYSIASIAANANGSAWTVTTTAASGLAAGESVTISSATQPAYDGTWKVASASTVTAPYTFTISSKLNPGPAGYGGTAAPVAAGITLDGNGSPMTVSANITAPGTVALVEPETGSGGDNLSVSPGATVASEGSFVALAAGDNINIASGATIQASSAISIAADTNDARYQGKVTFDREAAGGDSLVLPAGGATWTSLGYAKNSPISVSGATSAANNGAFTISSISADGYTLTLTVSNVLTSETDSAVSVQATDGANDVGNPPTANVTVAGTLSAPSASITVPSGSTRPVNFNITPSATTPITVIGSGQGPQTTIASGSNGLSLPQSTIDVASTTGFPSSGTLAIAIGGSTVYVTYTGTTSTSFTGCSGGTGTLGTGDIATSGDTLNVNLNTAGLNVTISETQTTTGTQTLSSGTIAVPGMRTITFTNIAAVTITDAAAGAGITLDGNSLVANTMTLVGSGQGAGSVTLDNALVSFSGAASFIYQGGGHGDTFTVTPYTNLNVPWNLAVTVAGGTGSPANLTFDAEGPYDTVTATANAGGAVAEPGVATVNFANVAQVTVNALGISNDVQVPNLTVADAGGIYNTNPFPATTTVNGATSTVPTLTYYSGTLINAATQLSGAPSSAGVYTVVATLPASGTYVGASAVTSFIIYPAPPQVTVNPVNLTYGTALANSQLSGTATFTINQKNISVPGTFRYTTDAGRVLNVGTTNEAVTFTPNSAFYTTLTQLTVPVNVSASATTTAVTSSLNPSGLNQNVTFTATVKAKIPGRGTPPTGTVTFKDGTKTLATGVALSGGIATFSTSFPAVGNNPITAVYSGDTNYNASTSATPLKQVVLNTTSTTVATTAKNPSPYGQKVTFTATVTPSSGGTPAGTVTFKDGAKVLGTATLSGGTASLSTALSAGLHKITAVYNGNSTLFYGGSTSAVLLHTVSAPAQAAAAAALLTANSAPKVTEQPASQTVAVGAPVTFTVAASGKPAPSVQWMVSTGTGKPFTPIAGATALSYSFTPQAGDTGKMFEAVLTNVAGKATSSAATLTVDVPPGVLADPIDQTAVHGQATFSVVLTGTRPTVQWQVSTDGGHTWSNVKSATSATLTLTGLKSLERKWQYRVLVTNALDTFTSGAATLSI